MKRVAILSCFYPYRGGISQFNASLMKELGKTCDVRAFNFKRQYPGLLFPGKTQYVTADDEAEAVDSVSMLDTINPISYERTFRAISGWGPDLVIVRYWMSWFAPSLGYVTRKLRKKGVKVVSILDNVIPHEQHFFDRPLTKWFLEGSDACVTLCEAVTDDLHDIVPGKPCITIFHPLYAHFGEKMNREEALLALNLSPERKTLLFFGLIREYKGLDILLQAFDSLDESYQLIVAGEPYGSFDTYRKQIDRMSGKDRIALVLHYVKDSEVKKYFSGADLCVLPYRSATQSGVSSTAFHFDVPMLVTDTGGLKETIADTGTGLLANECTPEAIRSRIVQFFSDPDIKAQCISNIAVRKQLLSWQAFADKLLDFANGIKK